jgi:hypothetical protein
MCKLLFFWWDVVSSVDFHDSMTCAAPSNDARGKETNITQTSMLARRGIAGGNKLMLLYENYGHGSQRHKVRIMIVCTRVQMLMLSRFSPSWDSEASHAEQSRDFGKLAEISEYPGVADEVNPPR